MNIWELVSRVRETAADSDGLVTVLPGLSAAELTGHRVAVGGDAFAFLRDVGGWSTPSHLASFAFAHKDNFGPAVNEVWPLGDGADHWIVDDTMNSTWYVHVDNGVWKRVYRFGEDPIPAVVAPDFLTWVDNLVTGVAVAVDAVKGLDDPAKAFGRAFVDWAGDPGSLCRQPDDAVAAVAVPTALASPDPVVAAAAKELPEDGWIADLRAVGYPTEVDFAEHLPIGEYPRYHHLLGGAFLGATVIPYD